MSVTQHLRVLRPAPGVLAFYDGRVAGHRYAAGDNWVDAGALSVGIASYALVEGDAAVVYDTHVTPEHAAHIRACLKAMGVRHVTVVLSHHHLDHVAGTAAFGDCEVIATAACAAHMARDRVLVEQGCLMGPPAIDPLVLPTRTFSGEMDLPLGPVTLRLIEVNIHSDDAAVIWREGDRLLLAGDTLEDCATYVVEPQGFAQHLRDLKRLAALAPRAILPNHGCPDRIAAGGYPPSFIAATADYVRWMTDLPAHPGRASEPLRQVIARWLDDGTLTWFDGYDEVHAENIARVLAHG